MDARWRAYKPKWDAYIENYRARFALQVAYFSALELRNEIEARRLAEALVHKYPDDAEYQDGLGFVLMRFAKSEAELERARVLFERAITNFGGEHATSREAAAHLKQAEALIAQLRSGNSRALEELGRSCSKDGA